MKDSNRTLSAIDFGYFSFLTKSISMLIANVLYIPVLIFDFFFCRFHCVSITAMTSGGESPASIFCFVDMRVTIINK